MVIHRQQWADYLQQLVALDKGNHQVRIYPVAISKTAFSVSDVVNDKNFVRVFEKETTEQKARFLTVTLAHEFCRLILGFQRATDPKQDSLPRLKLFLSHSKADGVEITKLLKYWIQEFTGLETFLMQPIFHRENCLPKRLTKEWAIQVCWWFRPISSVAVNGAVQKCWKPRDTIARWW